MNLYHEKAGLLDGDADNEVDLSSYAYQIWKNALAADPGLQKTIAEMPNVVYSTRALPLPPAPLSLPGRGDGGEGWPEGALVYLRTPDGNDALAWVDRDGNSVTESQFTILKTAECAPDTPAIARHENHHDLVRQAVQLIAEEERTVGGTLGRPSGARFRTYERLKNYAERVRGTLFDSPELQRAIEEIYRYPLRQAATDTLNRQLRAEISDEALANLVVALRDDDRLCLIHDEDQSAEPSIICSLGLRRM